MLVNLTNIDLNMTTEVVSKKNKKTFSAWESQISKLYEQTIKKCCGSK